MPEGNRYLNHSVVHPFDVNLHAPARYLLTVNRLTKAECRDIIKKERTVILRGNACKRAQIQKYLANVMGYHTRLEYFMTWRMMSDGHTTSGRNVLVTFT
jgi:hypothetical protein